MVYIPRCRYSTVSHGNIASRHSSSCSNIPINVRPPVYQVALSTLAAFSTIGIFSIFGNVYPPNELHHRLRAQNGDTIRARLFTKSLLLYTLAPAQHRPAEPVPPVPGVVLLVASNAAAGRIDVCCSCKTRRQQTRAESAPSFRAVDFMHTIA